MPQYADIPAGFQVKQAAYSDLPPGFSVSAQPSAPQAPSRKFVGPMPEFGSAKDFAIGAGDLLVSGARALVNKPATTLAGLVGAVNPNDTYIAARDRERAKIATDRYAVRDERLRTPQGQTLATLLSVLPKTEAQLALALPGELGQAVGGEAGRDVADSAMMLATLRTPEAMTAKVPRIAPRAPAPRPVRAPAPSLEELGSAAKDAYASAENAGVVISRDTMARIAREVKGEMADQGIDATLHPDSLAALNRLIAAGENHTSLKGAEILRRVIKDAEASTKPADARMASVMRDAFDERIEGLGANDVIAGQPGIGVHLLQDARQLYSRTAKGEDIQELFRRAELKAGANYTAAGIETALRQEFRALAMNKRRIRRFTPEEQAAIELVAKGGSLENAMRYFGKFSASSPLAMALSGSLGMMFGGPLAAIGVPIAGTVAKSKAAQLTMRNANAVSELVRRGPQNALAPAPQPEAGNALTRRR